MKNLFTNAIISQAISLGFDFSEFTSDTEILEVEKAMIDFFHENSDKLPRIEDECEVTNNGRSQNVSYDDYVADGQIVDFSAHWHLAPDTKVFHSDFIMEHEGIIKNMHLYYLVGETEFNVPDGYIWSKKENRHVKETAYLTRESIKITNSEKALKNADYILDALEYSSFFDNTETNGKTVEIDVKDVSMSLASGYGTWKVIVKLDIMGNEQCYEMTHHNEEWYLSQKIAYDASLADSDEEYEEALSAFQSAFVAVIDRHADDIVWIIEQECEEETE